MTDSTSTEVIFGGVWYNRVVAKQEVSHSTTPANKQINEGLRSTTFPGIMTLT